MRLLACANHGERGRRWPIGLCRDEPGPAPAPDHPGGDADCGGKRAFDLVEILLRIFFMLFFRAGGKGDCACTIIKTIRKTAIRRTIFVARRGGRAPVRRRMARFCLRRKYSSLRWLRQP